ncbi:MAG: hypothetical protein V3V08_04955 [Nannocystaceae bacterium]
MQYRRLAQRFIVIPVAFGLSGGACAPDEEALIIRTVPQWANEQCSVSGEATVGMVRGQLDLSFDSAYMQPYVLQNNLTRGGGPTSGNNGTDDSEIQLSAVSVRLDLPQDPSIIEAVSAIDPALVQFRVGISTASLGGGDKMGQLVDVIPRATAEALRDAILARYDSDVALTVYSKTIFHAERGSNSSLNDNNEDRPDWANVFEVDSREYSYPIELCFGCLRHCPTNPENTERKVAIGRCGNAQDGPATPENCSPADDTDGV